MDPGVTRFRSRDVVLALPEPRRREYLRIVCSPQRAPENQMASKNKGGREVRKPKADKKPKAIITSSVTPPAGKRP